MKVKKCFKRVLSVLLTAAMVMTTVPSTANRVEASEAVPSESFTEEISDLQQEKEEQQGSAESEKSLKEQSASELPQEEETQRETEISHTTKTPADEQETETKEQDTADSKAGDEQGEAETETSDVRGDNTANEVNVNDGDYHGPTVDYGTKDTPGTGKVTIYYYAQNFTEEVSDVKIKGAWDSGWNDHIEMTASSDENGVWYYEFPLEKIGKDKACEYGFIPNASTNGNNWDIDDCNKNENGNSKILRNPNIDGKNNVTLYYYPAHGSYPTAKVKYRLKDSGDTYTEAAMAKDAVYTHIYSTVISGLADGTYEYIFDVDGTEVPDTSNPVMGEFQIETKTYPAEKENIKAPIIEGDTITFLYYGHEGNMPKDSSVQLAGSMMGDSDWNKTLQNMIYQESGEYEGYWTYTMPLSAGRYEYKFVINGTDWKTDPLKDALTAENGNSLVVMPGLLGTTANVVIGKETDLPTTLEFLKADNTTEDKSVSYTLSDEAKDYSDKIELNENKDNNTTSIIISDDWSTAITSIDLIATDSDANTAVVTVKIATKTYEEDENLKSPVVGKGEATFYYFAPTATKVDIKGEMTGSAWPTIPMKFDMETGYWVITLQMPKGTYQYGFEVDGKWSTDPLNPPADGEANSVVTITESSADVSPIVEGNKVTFRYKDDTAEKVSVAGTMNEWTPNADMMKKNTETGYWELVMESMPAGEYQYKFVVGEDGWKNDPLNENVTSGNDPNNIFWVCGLVDSDIDATLDGKAAKLPKTLTLYTMDENTGKGNAAETAVTYALSKETQTASYKDKITLTAGTDTDPAMVSLEEDFPAEVTAFTLTAADAVGNTSTITVHVVEAKYTYTIYYYDRDHTVDQSALWIWENKEVDGVKAIEFPFAEAEELSDGNTWLKAVVELSYVDLGIIAKSKGSWDWQSSDILYSNHDAAEAVTLYIMADDPNIYTELPEVVILEDRYLVVEYTRSDAIADWQLYTWNSGYGSDVWVPFEAVEGSTTKGIAKVRIKHGLSSLSYCLAKTIDGDNWGQKDGNDYLCTVPVDQTVVKIQMEEGKGITNVYPYNIGYEIAPLEETIHFYYRSNDAFLNGSSGGYFSVAIEIDGKEYVMAYNDKEQRYTYDLTKIAPGTYKYRYVLKSSKDGEKEYVIDRYNKEKVIENEKEYSVCKYESFQAAAEANIWNDSMDYNDNNVISVKLTTQEEGVDLSALKVVQAYADLSELGGGITEIEPELMELSIAVKEGVSLGEKVIPIVVCDQYNNEYRTQVSVNVTGRNKGADFDWDEAVIYFAVTDRFFDGNQGNNGAGCDKSENGSSSYHGGDFAGLTQKLDYLKELGINTIWITPIVANDMEDGLNTDVAGIKSWGYHGYWASDFTKLDSHLGTEEEFKALLDAAHARGIKLMVDVVLNHSGYGQEAYFNNILKDEDGNAVQMIRDSSQMVNGSDQQTSLSGLPDFLTENAEVRELLVEWQSNWISKYDIDYYRVDTVKHVDDATWSAFKNALTKLDPDFKMIGEWAGAGYATDTGMLRTGRMDSLLDFDFNNQMTNFVTGSISETETFMRNRNAAIDNTATLGAFLGSHDEDGFVYNLMNEKKQTKERAEQLALVAASLQITAKGQAVIYYGEEIGMTGANNYPYQTNRYDFDWSQINDNNKTLVHYKKLLTIRNRYSEVLAKGIRNTIEASDEKGLDIFEKQYGDTKLTIALNISDKEAEYTFSSLEKNTMYTDCYSGMRYVTDSEGKTTVIIPAAADGGTMVLAKGELEEKFIVTEIADQVYTGSAIKLSSAQLKVYYGVRELQEGTDYTVKYAKNKTVGEASITITGKGNYVGKEKVTFQIVPRSVNNTDVSIQYKEYLIKTNKIQKPLEKITYNGKKLGTKDYIVRYYRLAEDGTREGGDAAEVLNGVKETGSYEMEICGIGNFKDTYIKKVTVQDTGTYMSKTNIVLEQNSFDYNEGNAIMPKVTVTLKDKGKTTVAEECYTVTYDNNVNVGNNAKVIVTGNPDKGYFGSVTKTFKIIGKKLSAEAEVDLSKWQAKVDYDIKAGQAQQPEDIGLLLKASKTPLVKDIDYTISYTKNTKPGKASIIFTGKGKYTGTIKKTFTINKIALTIDDTKLEYTVAPTAPYAKKGAKAAVTLYYDGVLLKEGNDYKLTYTNNKTVGSKAVVTINGTGVFSGKVAYANDSTDTVKTTMFEVVEADLSEMQIVVKDVVSSTKKGKFMSVPVLTDSSNAKLTNKKDFTLTYYLIEADGTKTQKTAEDIVGLTKTTIDGKEVLTPSVIEVVATALGSNYVDNSSQSAIYRVVQTDISKAKVTAKAKIYTGNAITLDENDLTVKIGSEQLAFGVDYDIVDGSYVNNVKKGTASVTIQGIGNYGGTKKVTFKISSRTVAWWWNLVH